jgi:hypothetical protein
MSFEVMQFVLPHGVHTSASQIDTLADGAVLAPGKCTGAAQLNLSMEQQFF